MMSFTRRRSCFRYWQSKRSTWARIANLAVMPEDLRALANQRATVVRNRLETEGKVPRERLFLVEPKLDAADIKDSGAKTRVDFSLK
jgi:hypothetical protein